MLGCEDCERYLEAFLDQELDVKESLDIQAHLHACPACMGLAEAERSCRRFVREHGYEVPLPDTLKLQLIRRAMEDARPVAVEPKVTWWEWLGAWISPKDFALGMASAAAILLFFFGPVSFRSQVDGPTDYFQAERVSHEVSMAYRNATKLLGGRLCRLFDRPSATFVYKRNGKDVMLFAFRGDGVSLPTKNRIRVQDQDMYLHDVSGRPVAVWQHGGIVYSMVGANREDLLKIAKTMYYR
jgi:anti-sigma factor RsiW